MPSYPEDLERVIDCLRNDYGWEIKIESFMDNTFCSVLVKGNKKIRIEYDTNG